MKRAALLMPSHPPERSIADGQCWDLAVMGVYPVTVSFQSHSHGSFVTFQL
jgi:hypothetical protein